MRARLAVAAGIAAGLLAAVVAHLGGVFAADLVGWAVGFSTFFSLRGVK
jgi:hypothetical protein